MAETNFDVEQIVREVMARLVPGTSSVSSSATSTSELRLEERLVTLESLRGRLAGVQRLLVPPRAIVTPAVRDHLRERGIAITTQAAADSSTAASTKLIAWADPNVELETLNNLLAADDVSLKHTGCPDLPTAVRTITRSVADKSRWGLIVTEATCAALCLANRHAGIQAILGQDPADVECAVRNISANVLVVSPKLGSFIQKRLIQTYCRTERSMHAAYQEHL